MLFRLSRIQQKPFLNDKEYRISILTAGVAFSSSVVYSLVGTAKDNNPDPNQYLLLLLIELQQIDGPISADILRPILH